MESRLQQRLSLPHCPRASVSLVGIILNSSLNWEALENLTQLGMVSLGSSLSLTALLHLSSAAMDVGIIIMNQTLSCIHSKFWLLFWTLRSLRTSSVTWECKCQHEGVGGEAQRKGECMGVLHPTLPSFWVWSPNETPKPLC